MTKPLPRYYVTYIRSVQDREDLHFYDRSDTVAYRVTPRQLIRALVKFYGDKKRHYGRLEVREI